MPRFAVPPKKIFLLIKNVHTEQTEESVAAIVFHLTDVCQFLDKNTVCRHAGIFEIREFAGKSLCLGTGGAEGAAAGTYDQTVVTGFTHFPDHTELGSVMAFLGVFDRGHIGIVFHLPDGLQDQCFLMRQNPLLHFFRTAAIGRTGIVRAILSTEIFFAVWTEGRVKYDFCGIYDCRGGKSFLHRALDHFCFCHGNHLAITIRTGQEKVKDATCCGEAKEKTDPFLFFENSCDRLNWNKTAKAASEKEVRFVEYTKNFGFRHKAGVILSVSSLPSQYGIGSFGEQAHNFIDFLDATGQRVWQVLPLNPTSYGDSPYQSPASDAGNPYFIDLPILAKKGLLTKEELEAQRYDSERVDYGRLFNTRFAVLRTAYSRFRPDRAYKTFVKKNSGWLEPYALFMALKVHYGHRQWTAWEENHRDYRKAVLCSGDYEQEMGFWRWVQYEFDAQWQQVRKHAKEKSISIIGDMPIYVAHDSVDVWAAPEQFLLDERFNPTVVAGCPPDGFTPDGQLWGNPIYNWERMEQEHFAWWISRIGRAYGKYDILRIDHFRGFAGYFNVPYGHATARNGKWDSAPGIALFRTMRETYPKAKIIAEDLGFITDDVRELLTDTGFPGMKMLHFAFYDEDSENLPRMYENRNCVVYSASHDSDCSVTWVRNIRGDARRRFNRECKRNKAQHRVYDLIEFAFNSKANLAMVPMQDYLLLSNAQGRMNEPATATGNWNWRMSKRYDSRKLRCAMLDLAVRTKRAK